MLTLLFFVFSSSLFYGQSKAWEMIETPDSSHLDIVYFSSEGKLFAKMWETDDMFFSGDLGITWFKLGTNILKISNIQNSFKEDAKANIYMRMMDSILVFDPDIIQFKEYYKSQDNKTIIDYSFLNSGNLLVADDSTLKLISASGFEYRKHSWSVNNVYLMPDKVGQSHYMMKSNSAGSNIVTFTENLDFSSTENDIVLPAISYLRVGDRIIKDDRYSDDEGKTWNQFAEFENDSYTSTLGHNNTLYFNSGFKIYTSIDGGKTLTLIPNPNPNPNYFNNIRADKHGNVISSSTARCDHHFWISNDSYQTWQINNLKVGPSRSSKIVSGVSEHLYTNFDCGELVFKSNRDSPWKLFDINGEKTFVRNLFAVSDGSILCYLDNGLLYNTTNNGVSWHKLYQGILIYDEIKPIVKEGFIMIPDYDSLRFSLDLGLRWESVAYEAGFLFEFNPRAGLTCNKEFEFYYIDKYNFDLHRYGFETSIETKIESPTRYLNFGVETSYDSKVLYLLGRQSNSINNFNISVSYDKGNTFQSYDLGNFELSYDYRVKVMSDHLNNVYVYGKNKILMSSDQGENWINITPDFEGLFAINDMQVSYDNYIYLATTGLGILKYAYQLGKPSVLTVSVFDDLNKDCEKDATESLTKNANVLVNNLQIIPLNSDGEATVYLYKPENTISLLYNSELYKTCTDTFKILIDTAITNKHLDIPLQTIKYCADPKVNISSLFLRRCFPSSYQGRVCNEGSVEAESTKIEITLDSFLEFNHVDLPVISHIGNTLILDVGKIKSGQCVYYTLSVDVSCEASLGQEHCVTVSATTSTSSCNESMPISTYTECQMNLSSFDPNDKSIFVNGNRNQTYVQPGDKIEYMIRFQNTGTDTAFTVRVEDPISDKFNIKSLKPLLSSHPYEWSIEDGTLVVMFQNINLVDSFTNGPLSNGFIKFEIGLESSVQLGESFSNSAAIFFDSNDAVITNEVITNVGKPSGTIDQLKNNYLSIRPNPSHEYIIITDDNNSEKPSKFIIYDLQGRIVFKSDYSDKENRIDIRLLDSGTYLILMISETETSRGKFVKI